MSRAPAYRRHLTLWLSLALLTVSPACLSPSSPTDAGRSRAPDTPVAGSPFAVRSASQSAAAQAAEREARARFIGWQEGQRQGLAGTITNAQTLGPDEFRSRAWFRLSMAALLTLILGFLARLVMGIQRPNWWAWLRRRSTSLDDHEPSFKPPKPTQPSDSNDETALPSLATVAAKSGWRMLQSAVRAVGHWTLGPAPRDHVWRREIHQSRDAERDLKAAMTMAVGFVERTEASADSAPSNSDTPLEAPSAAGAAARSADATAADSDSDDASKSQAASWRALADVLELWRSEVTNARRRLTAMEPMDYERALLRALDETQSLAAEVRVTLTRLEMTNDDRASAALRDVWLRRAHARPDLARLAPPAPKLPEGADWGGWTAVGGLAASALGIFALGAWAAAGALPLFIGIVLAVGGPIAFGIARLQLDRTGRPRLLPGVADRLASRVATTALTVGMLLWGSTWFGDETNLGRPPEIQPPPSLQLLKIGHIPTAGPTDPGSSNDE